MTRSRTKPPAVRREEILRAARKALLARGYHDVRLDEVATAAGISKGTLYLYFKDKESLFAAALGDVIGRMEARLAELPVNKSALDALRDLAAEMLDFVDEHRDFLVQFSREKPDLCGKRAGILLQQRFNEHMRFVSEKIQRCIGEGSLRAHDPMLGSLLFISLVRMFMLQQVMGLTKGDLRKQAGLLMKLFVDGLGARAGVAHA